MKRMRTAMTMMMALLPLQAGAQDPRGGSALAERWCMACHVIEGTPRIATDNGVPSFPAIAARPGTTSASLDDFLSSAHTRMPDFSLSRIERDALVAYILSLR